MVKQNIFIHPGCAKSGTTTLQENLFGKHNEILSIGRPFTDLNRQIRKEIGKIEGINYDGVTVASLIDEALKNGDSSTYKCIVWSDETLISNAFMRKTIANRLRGFFPDSHVIFTIRNQIKALESFYANHGRVLIDVPEPHNGRFVSLDNWLSYAYENKETTYLGLIDYFTTINMYQEVFGEDRVHVFLFEEFVNNKKYFTEKLSRLLSIDAEQSFSLLTGKHNNPRITDRTVTFVKIYEKILPVMSIKNMIPFGNIIQKWFSNYLAKGKGARIQIPNNWEKQLKEFYKEGNYKLMGLKRLPLEEYGYPL
jgi:hypothetical protein